MTTFINLLDKELSLHTDPRYVPSNGQLIDLTYNEDKNEVHFHLSATKNEGAGRYILRPEYTIAKTADPDKVRAWVSAVSEIYGF